MEETKREVIIWKASDPESEIVVDFFVLGVKNVLHLSHEFKTQMAVVEHDPPTRDEALFNELGSRNFLLFSHRHFTSWELLLLLGELVDWSSWISTS